jgi:3-methyladenine DNA glycosylase AlkD
MLDELEQELQSYQNPITAAILKRFLKTGIGEYAQGDIVIGIRVPILRKIAKKYKDLPLIHIQSLVQNPIHEYRLLGLLIMVNAVKKIKVSQSHLLEAYYLLALQNIRYINHWDLVDTAAPDLFGKFLYATQQQSLLYDLIKSESVWERRIAVLLGFYYIRQNDYSYLLSCAQALLHDQHDLIHKAVGWMLREIGKRDIEKLRGFLYQNALLMPRTMLRYAIEKLDEEERQLFLGKSKNVSPLLFSTKS